MRLAKAPADVIDILQGRPAGGGGGPDDRERMIAIIAENYGLSNNQVMRIESRPHSEENSRRFRR